MEASTKKKLVFGALGLGMLLLLNRAGELQDTINGLQFGFVPGGMPKLLGLTGLEWPVKVRVTNAGQVTLPLQGLSMTLGRLQGSSVQPLAQTDPAGVVAPPIQARAVTEFIVPVRTTFLGLLTEIVSIYNARGLGRYVLAPTIFSNGVRVPLSPITLTY